MKSIRLRYIIRMKWLLEPVLLISPIILSIGLMKMLVVPIM